MANPTAPSWKSWRVNPPNAISSTGNTFAHHPELSRLPVPKLEQTAEKLIYSASALATSEHELEELQRKLGDFTKSGGVGERLQGKLKARAEQQDILSWIAEWWDTQAYMAFREPVVINVSYYYGFNKLPQSRSSTSTDPYAEKANPAFVAASLVSTVLDFRALLMEGKIEPDTAGTQKLDMESYKWMFNACRIPSKPVDYAIKLREDDPSGANFIVVRNNRYYKMPLWDKSGNKWSLETLQSAFEEIYSDTTQKPPVGLMTGVDRDLWTDARAHLLKISDKNVSVLSAIEAASFVLCLDPATPSSAMSSDGSNGSDNVITFSRELMHGNGENRWFDKPLQWVVFDSGEAGFVGEHSCMDGTPTAKMNDYLGQRLLSRDFPGQGSEAQVPATLLTFDVDDRTHSSITEARSAYLQAVSEQAMGYLHYSRYGKEGIKKQKCSPDGWVQMVMQLAYGLTFPDSPVTGTYEAAMTRKFALGRTETVRICSPASKAFVLAMLPGSGVSDTTKRHLFLEALKQHGKDMRDASNAQGVDRHLFGLKMLAAESGEKVELFEDELAKRSGTWRMSTSLIHSNAFRCYGWGQVVPDGFGLPYSIHSNHLVWTVTSKRTQQNAQYTSNLAVAADLLMDMSESALAQETGEKAKL